MANLNKIDVPVAVEHKTKLDLSCDHVTTMGFMRVRPVFYRHMMRTEHINIGVDSVVRPAPIEVPFFGSCVQNLRAFFVPYRLVFPQWENFINDNIGSNMSNSSLVVGPPILGATVILDMFVDAQFGLTDIDPNNNGDFYTNGIAYKFRRKGRRFLTILESLGYKMTSDKNTDYNAMALLAVAKVYLDWYANSQYLNSQGVLDLEKMLAYNDPSSQLAFDRNALYFVLDLIHQCVYDVDDYYVNAWDNPVSPNSGQYTQFVFSDPTANNGAYVTMNNGTPVMYQSGAASTQIGTTYIHEALKKLTDYQKRHALAGARSIDRVLASYGISTDYLKQQRSIYCGSQKIAVETGSVMSTASGQSPDSASNVGDYSGAGFGKGGDTFDFKTEEEGIFLILASIIPAGGMVQGFDRNNLHMNRDEFFVPEFDSLGCQGIMKGEVYVSDDLSAGGNPSHYLNTFGFSGRYGEYKRPKSWLTGDFRLSNRFFVGADAWHLFRMFDDNSFVDANNVFDIDYISHSLDFTRSADAEQYYRVFQFTDDAFDPFYCFLHFNVASFAPCKPLFETYDFEQETKQVSVQNGNKVN